MKKLLLAGAALVALTGAALAHGHGRGGGGALDAIDADNDGYITRAEAQAEAVRMFDRLDANDDNRLDSADRPERGERREHVEAHRERRGVDGEERRVEREVIIERHDGPGPGHGGHGPGRGPMMAMLIASSDEADLNGDGALSRDEFVAQQIRFFDAGDANRDGRIRFERPAAPPQQPAPPTPPARR